MKNIKKFFLLNFLSCLPLLVFAGKPILVFTPLTMTNKAVASNSTDNVMYRVTNASSKTHTFAMKPISAVQQVTTSGFCSSIFTLAYQQSCILNLQINGANLQTPINEGPEICQVGSNLLCYQPALNNILSISLKPKENTPITLIVGNSPLTLVTGGASSGITLTNNSTSTATNLHANLTGTVLDGNIIQDASNCTQLLAGQTCTLLFTPGLNAISLTSFPIEGDNIRPISGQIEVTGPSLAAISISGSPLVLQATTGIPLSGNLTITNQSTTITATNITADISGALASSGVIEDDSACFTLLPQQSCTLTFFPADQAANATSVNIQGSNTSLTTAIIAVNGAPQAPLSINSSLTLYTNGADGYMSIQNDSPTEYAYNIQANFTGTALNGLVTETGNSCTNLAPGDNCLLTFTPGSQGISFTNFPIQGTNTTAVNGTIEIGTPIIYLTSNSYTGNLGGFSGADAICDSDPGKPSSGFAIDYFYKALLVGNNATITGINYYRPDGTTLIATATGGDLVGISSLVNSITTNPAQTVWTGYGGTASTTCNNWATTSQSGTVGVSNQVSSLYLQSSSSACTNNFHLYCVSQ